jgi:NTP pyrophosphatase (non-canonical NTP hydrolase)
MSKSEDDDDFCVLLNMVGNDCLKIEREHGFGNQSPGEDIALFHSEISEALEEMRNGRALNEVYFNPEKPTKPEGVPAELADVVIRILSFCQRNQINLGRAILQKMVYNRSRPFRHGGKAL